MVSMAAPSEPKLVSKRETLLTSICIVAMIALSLSQLVPPEVVPTAPLTGPTIIVVKDSLESDQHLLGMRIASSRQASTFWVAVQNATILRASIDGKKVPSKMVD